jgi:hypothetical protein
MRYALRGPFCGLCGGALSSAFEVVLGVFWASLRRVPARKHSSERFSVWLSTGGGR